MVVHLGIPEPCLNAGLWAGVLVRAQELCESRGGRPGPHKSPYGLCGHKATLNNEFFPIRAQELCEGRGGRSELPVPNSPYDLCGRKATLN